MAMLTCQQVWYVVPRLSRGATGKTYSMLDKSGDNARKLTDLNDRLTYRLSRLQARLNKHAVALLSEHGDLTLTQWRLLTSIDSLGTTTLAELVREMQYDKAQLSRGVTSLEALGLVRMEQDETDNRRHLISLTNEGQAEHARLMPVFVARQRVLRSGLSETQLDQLFAALDQIDATLDEEGI